MVDSVIHLLLVEDDEDDYIFTRHLLGEARGCRFEVSWADRMETALNYLSDSKVDIILLDLTLPDSFGWETFTKMRAHVPGIPIVLLTGLHDEDLGTKAVHAGAQDYLVKGDLSTQLLTRSITYAIERLRAQDALQTAYCEMESLINQRTRELTHVQQQLQVESGRRERAEQNLKDGNHLEAVCAFVDSVADKVKGLVHGIRETASAIAVPHPNGHEHKEHCHRIIAAADHADDLSSHLVSLARAVGLRPPQMEVVEPSRLLRGTVSRYKEILSDQGIMVRITEMGAASSVRVDPEQLGEIVRRMLSNAALALPDGGEICIGISEPIAAEGPPSEFGMSRVVSIDIAYSGIDMEEPLMDRLLQPEGAEDLAAVEGPPGLQVSLVQSRVKGWGGVAEMLQTGQGGGVRLLLPVLSEAGVQSDGLVSQLLGDGRILVVDDDPKMRVMVQAALEQAGYAVDTAPSHEEGLESLKKNAGVALVFLDAVMPRQGSVKVMEWLMSKRPDVVSLISSGFCRDYVQTLVPGKNWTFLQKPFDAKLVVETVNALVRRYAAERTP